MPGFALIALANSAAGSNGLLLGAATLLGVVMFVHQIGAFLGVWLGGIAVTLSGSHTWVWYADIVLALIAVAIHVPLREQPAAAHAGLGSDANGVSDAPLRPATA